MTAIEKRVSLVELEESTPEGAREMAAARAEVRISHLLLKALRMTGETQEALAEKLGVTPGRVSQVLNSQGNVRVSTAARYLRAMGYALQVDAIPAEADVPQINAPRRRRKTRPSAEAYSHTDASGKFTLILSDGKQSSSIRLEGLVPLGPVAGELRPISNQNRGQTVASFTRHPVSKGTNHEA